MSQPPAPLDRSLLPDSLYRPHWLLWVWTLPTGILLLLNYHAWWLAEGEMSPEQHVLAMQWGAFNLVNLLGSLAFFAALKWRRRSCGWKTGLVVLVLQCAYLWFTTANCVKVLPDAVTAWILPVDRLLFTQWTWAMPPAFFGVLLLVGFPLRRNRWVEAGYSLAAIVLGPGLIYLLFTGLFSIFGEALGTLRTIVFLLLFIGATVLLGLGIIRLLLILFTSLFREKVWAMNVMVVLFALILPLGGLLLNRTIPFPADYQDHRVYLLTVLNAVVLFFPVSRSARFNLVLLLLRCLFFPFTLYFFLVFLPFLPLAIPAILAVATGFLILAPTILFVVHLLRLREVWLGGLPLERVPALCLGLLAFAVLPVFITVQSLYLGHQLKRGLDWIYAPDTASHNPFDGSPKAVGNACLWLRDYKNGRFLPYLTPYREWLMFDGLVLPDDKLAHIYESFSGKPFEPGQAVETWSFGFLRSQSTNRRQHRMPGVLSSNRDVVLQSLQSETVSDGGIARTTLRLDIQSMNKREQSEYLCHFSLPEGVLVSGFWLHIDAERVPGRIFEKKAALWVYQMIRDSRRDPGLLFHTGPNTLQLHVFPLEPGQIRTVELELMYPGGLARNVEIDGKSAPLGDIRRVALITSDTGVAVLNKPALDELPLIQRNPYWHFIIDHSLQAPSPEAVLERIQTVQALNPSITRSRVTLASFESTLHFDSPDSLEKSLPASKPIASGGFLPDRAIAQAMARYADESLRTDSDFKQFPLFVIISDRQPIPWKLDLRPFADRVPEAPGVLVATSGQLSVLDWQGQITDAGGFPESIQPVSLLAMGESVRPVPEGLWSAVCFFAPDSAGQSLRFLESESRLFMPMSDQTALSQENAYAQALGLQAAALAAERNPSQLTNRLPELVKESKAQGVLIPQTSYIVVENSAQWRILEQTEKDKLKGNPELELMETPEPAVWLLGGLLIAFEIARRRFKTSP